MPFCAAGVAWVLKNNKDVLSKPLFDLFNFVFVFENFPQQLKTATIIPIYKKHDSLISFFLSFYLKIN